MSAAKSNPITLPDPYRPKPDQGADDAATERLTVIRRLEDELWNSIVQLRTMEAEAYINKKELELLITIVERDRKRVQSEGERFAAEGAVAVADAAGRVGNHSTG